MVTYTQLINGLSRYIDTEIINKLTGNSKLLLGIGSGIALKKGENIYKLLQENSIIKMLDLIDKDGNIDIETIFEELRKQARKQSIEIDIPIIGILKLNEEDITKLQTFVKGV